MTSRIYRATGEFTCGAQPYALHAQTCRDAVPERGATGQKRLTSIDVGDGLQKRMNASMF